MQTEIKQILEKKYRVQIDSLLYPNKAFHIVNPVIKDTEKRYLFYSLMKKGEDLCLMHGSWKNTDDEGLPVKYYDMLTGKIDKKELEKLKNSTPKPKQDVDRLKYVFKKGTKKPDTPYVKKKGIKMFCAVNNKGATLVPIYNQAKFIGFQSIKEDGTKRFIVSETIKGAYSVIQEFDDNNIVYITEGFATGATVSMAVPSATVISALTLSNILSVATFIRKEYPEKIVLVCLDKPNNEQVDKQNTNIKKQFTCIEPDLRGKKGSDMNDLMLEFGLEEVTKQILNLQSTVKSFRPVPMGYDETHYYVYSQRLNDILKFSRDTTIKPIALSLAPRSFWEKNFKAGDRNVTKEDWEHATDAYIQMCIEKGWFDTSKIRGMGVYADEDKTVYNDGKNLFYVGSNLKPINRHDIRSDYRYTFSSSTIGDISKSSKLRQSELDELCEAVHTFDWAHKNNAKLLLGWIVQSIFSGLSDWRSHIWIVGDTSTGKSFIKDNVFQKLIPFRRKVSGMTSPAGVLQELSPHGLPFVHEECEAEDRKSSDWIVDILKIHRVSSSSLNESIGRGTPQGVPIRYPVRHSCCNMSINSYLPLKQDKERFMLLELVQNSKTKYKKGADFFRGLTNNYYKRFLMTVLLNLDVYKQNFEQVMKYIEKDKTFTKLTLHAKRCTSSCIAGYNVLQPHEDLKTLTLNVSETVPKYNMKNTVDTSLQEDHVYDFLSLLCPKKWSVGEGITFLMALLNQENTELFSQLGVRLTREGTHMFLWVKSPIIKHLYRENEIVPLRTRTTDIRALAHLPIQVTKIGGRSFRCIKINIGDYTGTKK